MTGEMLLRTGGVHAFNLGTGIGMTVGEIVAPVEKVAGGPLPVRLGPRRPGDPAALVVSAEKARCDLVWSPARSVIDFIVTDMKWWKSAVTLEAPKGL